VRLEDITNWGFRYQTQNSLTKSARLVSHFDTSNFDK